MSKINNHGVNNPCYRHGQACRGDTSNTYKSWCRMRQRCRESHLKKNQCYIGKAVCPRWDSFSLFYEDMGEQPDGCSLDRIDNNEGYYKENCRWATSKEQQRNRSITKMVTANGQTKPLGQWAEETGTPYQVLMDRLWKLGWSPDRAINTPKLSQGAGRKRR